ncbi:MAG TPA: SRPBCC family protein [Noviherbaspirillum sp.]|nr:SRPBCC family protein [Noviherbaspirillum sp.]
MTAYRFLTCWRIEAPLQTVFNAVFDSLRWPEWWSGAQQVEQLDPGDANGIGSLRRYIWKSALPYRLSFDARATRIEPPHVLEAHVEGDLSGYGRWTFHAENSVTVVRYEWDVRTTKRWMNLLAPIARQVFAYNHHMLMQRGAEGLAHRLRARLAGVSHDDLPHYRLYDDPKA